jgi:hypothetical protein
MMQGVLYEVAVETGVTGRQNGATDGRRNGATGKCRKRGLERGQDWAIFAPFATGFLAASGRGRGAR